MDIWVCWLTLFIGNLSKPDRDGIDREKQKEQLSLLLLLLFVFCLLWFFSLFHAPGVWWKDDKDQVKSVVINYSVIF